MRINNPRLAIERGRYNKRKLRQMKHIGNFAELVGYFKRRSVCFHCFVLLSCLKYEQARKDLLDIARSNSHKFNHLQMEKQFTF